MVASVSESALTGFRILDLTSVFLGPFATQILGDNGADVIKIEAPEGDITRDIQPARSPGMGAVFLNTNRNKRSMVLDLKKAAGRDAVLRLVRGADVLVHSVRPEAMKRLGLAYEDCRAVNPRIVYAAALGFRPNGPYSRKAAYDDIIQGLSGMVAMQAFTTGEPRYIPSSIVDKIVGTHLVYAISMALLHRERSGEGQQVDVPMLECMVGFNLLEHAAGMLFEPPLGEPGYARSRAPFRRPFATRDGPGAPERGRRRPLPHRGRTGGAVGHAGAARCAGRSRHPGRRGQQFRGPVRRSAAGRHRLHPARRPPDRGAVGAGGQPHRVFPHARRYPASCAAPRRTQHRAAAGSGLRRR